MPGMVYSVAKNTSFLTAASIGQKIISFVYFTIIARIIGVENTGQYFFALTFQNIFAVFADFGVAQVLTREISKSSEKTQSIFSTALGSKFVFGGAAYVAVVIFVNLLGYSDQIKNLIYLAGLTMWFDNFHSLFYAVFRAKRNLFFESAGIVGSQLLTLLIGTIALIFRLPLIWLIAAYTIPSFLNMIFSGCLAVKYLGIRIQMSFKQIHWKEFLAMAWPFALAGIIGRLYAYSDSLLMSKMLGERELGWWSVPYKITFAFQFIPLALSASVYPVFSSLWLSDRAALAKLFEKSWRYLFTIVFPLSAGIFAIAGPFISTVYGDNYLPSILPLRVLMISLFFGYLSLLTGALLNAIGQQRKQTSIMAGALVINLALNIMLIPAVGIVGAAISALVSNVFIWIIGYVLIQKYIEFNHKTIFIYALRSFFPAIIMGLLVFLLTLKVSFILAIPIGMAVYFVLMFVSGGLSKQIILEVKNKVIGEKAYENIDHHT